MSETRNLDDMASKELAPGAEHYRAFVGPPERYDLMGASQFRLLTTLGLRESHRVLDFGCGSLRAGRMLIAYLQPDCYFGVEPNQWLIDDAIHRQIGSDILSIKRPRFSNNEDFLVPFRGEPFDFVLAQSIFSHTGRALAQKLIEEFAQVLAPRGMVVVTFSVREDVATLKEDGWVYPGCVKYRQSDVVGLASLAGLAVMPIPYFHPSQCWFLMARDARMMPSAEHLWQLSGGVFNVEEFSASLIKPSELL